MEKKIRQVRQSDIPAILNMLGQVAAIHHRGRPDIYKKGGIKFTQDSLVRILDKMDKVFVCVSDSDEPIGYAFCELKEVSGHSLLADSRILYIEDFCVDENHRRGNVGKALFEHIEEYAQENGFDGIDLNVWSFNEDAIRFYEAVGMTPKRVIMEKKPDGKGAENGKKGTDN